MAVLNRFGGQVRPRRGGRIKHRTGGEIVGVKQPVYFFTNLLADSNREQGQLGRPGDDLLQRRLRFVHSFTPVNLGEALSAYRTNHRPGPGEPAVNGGRLFNQAGRPIIDRPVPGDSLAGKNRRRRRRHLVDLNVKRFGH